MYPKIRVANISDKETLVDFNHALALETEGKVLDRDLLAQGVAAQFANPGLGLYWLACDGIIPVGQCRIWFEYYDWKKAPIWWFDNIYSARRGRGVFRAIFNHLFALARAANIEKFRLHVCKSNKIAREVYLSLGFHAPSDMMELDLGAATQFEDKRPEQALQSVREMAIAT